MWRYDLSIDPERHDPLAQTRSQADLLRSFLELMDEADERVDTRIWRCLFSHHGKTYAASVFQRRHQPIGAQLQIPGYDALPTLGTAIQMGGMGTTIEEIVVFLGLDQVQGVEWRPFDYDVNNRLVGEGIGQNRRIYRPEVLDD